MAHDRPLNTACSWRLKQPGETYLSRTCSFPHKHTLKSSPSVKWNGSKLSTEAFPNKPKQEDSQRTKRVPFLVVWVWLWRLSKVTSWKTNTGGYLGCLETVKALNAQGEVTASDPKPKQGLTGWSSRWQPLESKCSCLHRRLSACTPRLEAPLTRLEVTGCPNKQVFRQEDNRLDSVCQLNCSNWRLNEFTEPEGRRWANEAAPVEQGDPTGREALSSPDVQELLLFLRKED